MNIARAEKASPPPERPTTAEDTTKNIAGSLAPSQQVKLGNQQWSKPAHPEEGEASFKNRQRWRLILEASTNHQQSRSGWILHHVRKGQRLEHHIGGRSQDAPHQPVTDRRTRKPENHIAGPEAYLRRSLPKDGSRSISIPHWEGEADLKAKSRKRELPIWIQNLIWGSLRRLRTHIPSPTRRKESLPHQEERRPKSPTKTRSTGSIRATERKGKFDAVHEHRPPSLIVFQNSHTSDLTINSPYLPSPS